MRGELIAQSRLSAAAAAAAAAAAEAGRPCADDGSPWLRIQRPRGARAHVNRARRARFSFPLLQIKRQSFVGGGHVTSARMATSHAAAASCSRSSRDNLFSLAYMQCESKHFAPLGFLKKNWLEAENL